MNHLALFNGIGGFQLAADWCGWNNIAHVEIDDFCNKVVARHFPNSVCHTDIKDFDGKQYAGSVDIISGGFPCQPYSVAGLRRGKEDDRALWPEMLRVISEVRPDWVVGENVAGIISMGIDTYISDLENTGEGYEVQCFVIPACAVNAPHRRDRVWIVADSKSLRNRRYIGKQEERQVSQFGDCSESSVAAYTNGSRNETWLSGQVNREEGHTGITHYGYQKQYGWERSWIETATRICGVDDGVSGKMDRGKRIKSLGNSIVPQVAYEIFKAINTIENERQIHQ